MVNYPNKKKNNHYTSMIEGKHNTAHRGTKQMNIIYHMILQLFIKNLPLFKLSRFLIQKEVQQK